MADDQYEMQNPKTQNNYPRPKFEKQTQPEPGLAKDMTPQPDHGEKSYKGSGRLKGRKALVTGADSGIGRAAAIAFAREGADILMNYLPEEEPDAKEVVTLIEKAGRKVVTMPGDLDSEDFCKQLIDKTVKELGGIDILANVAGKQIAQEDIKDISTEQFDKTFKVNVYAMFWLCKFAIPRMAPGSAIINTTSIQSYQPSPTLVDYASTKGAITTFTKALAKQVADKGTGPDLDAAAAQSWPAGGKNSGIRQPKRFWPARPAGGTGANLCLSGLTGIQLHHRRGYRCDRRQPPALVGQNLPTQQKVAPGFHVFDVFRTLIS
jgi:NADP-dependent 3-hydroxy acid dehydrogenase YdfG